METSTVAKHAPSRGWGGDLSGGLSAMLVALPSAVAFGLLVFGPLGPDASGLGAMAGIIGVCVIGLAAAAAGSTPRLISAPCAPAAAVLGAFTLSLASGEHPKTSTEIIALVMFVCAAGGLLQLLFGLLRGGALVKYIPYPVVNGYLSGVGILIIISQLPKLLSLSKGVSLASGLTAPGDWNIAGLIVGLVAAALMALTGRVTKRIPAPIIALLGGALAYFIAGQFVPSLYTLENNRLVIGRIEGNIGGLGRHIAGVWGALGSLSFSGAQAAAATVFTLAVLLSIDTLKTCIIVDAVTKSRHNSNRELVCQGIANMASAACGGISGAGTMGATMINLSGGATSRKSVGIMGALAAGVLIALAPLVAWIPVPALAGILIVIGARMIDRNAFKLLRQRETVLDFCVIIAVIVTAVATNLIAASGIGIALSLLLFIREQTRMSVVRRRLTGADVFSKKQRLPDDVETLTRRGRETLIVELQGSLFFGTTDKLVSEVEPHLKGIRFLVLDMRRVQAVDFSGAHLLDGLASRMKESGGALAFAHLPRSLPTGQKLEDYFRATGVIGGEDDGLLFAHLHDALEYIEDLVLAEERQGERETRTIGLHEIEIFSQLPDSIMESFSQSVKERAFAKGETIFRQKEDGDSFFAIRRGEVRILLPLADGHHIHLTTFGQGDFFGDMSFIDHALRSAQAVASEDTIVYELSRSAFDAIAEKNPKIGWSLYAGLSRVLAIRLRRANEKLRAIEDA